MCVGIPYPRSILLSLYLLSKAFSTLNVHSFLISESSLFFSLQLVYCCRDHAEDLWTSCGQAVDKQQGDTSPQLVESPYLAFFYNGTSLHKSSEIFLSIHIFVNHGKWCTTASSGSALINSAFSRCFHVLEFLDSNNDFLFGWWLQVDILVVWLIQNVWQICCYLSDKQLRQDE